MIPTLASEARETLLRLQAEPVRLSSVPARVLDLLVADGLVEHADARTLILSERGRALDPCTYRLERDPR